MREKGLEKHHVLFYRSQWESSVAHKTLRRSSGLVVPIEHDAHTELHRDIEHVPVPSHRVALAALNNYRYSQKYDSPVQNIKELQKSIYKASKNEKVSRLEFEVSGLAIEALDKQLEYLRGTGDMSRWGQQQTININDNNEFTE